MDAADPAPPDAWWLRQLRAEFSAGERIRFQYFWGHRDTGRTDASCLSQWFPAPFSLDGQVYATAEHWMMAEKARLFDDEAQRQKILLAPSPGAAKAAGRAVRGFDERRWQQERFAIVVRGNLAKFGQNLALRKYLMATGTKVLVEASPVDSVWGIGMDRHDPRAADPVQWAGLNLLGFALMAVREALLAKEPE